MKILKKLQMIKPVLPAMLLGIFVIVAVTGYRPDAGTDSDGGSWVQKILAARKQTIESQTVKAGKKGKGFDLKDGKYTGSANGYGGKITVTVTIKNKKIVKIHIDSAPGETTSFFNRAKTLTDLMIRQQSTDVDAVSGATYSSKGIIGAVKNALYGTKSTTKQAPASFGEKGKAKQVAKVTETGNWKDGTYTGKAQGFGGLVKVKVTVKNGKIKKIQIVSASGETGSYFAKAKALIPAIVKKQTTNVDAVSGATYSSNGIIRAVRKALGKASTTSKKTKTQKKSSKKNTKKQTVKPGSGTVPYINGTYYGTGEGRNGEIKVKLTIKNKKIVSLVVVSHKEDAPYFAKAKKILTMVLKRQSAKVDAVSGATLSSNGLIEAIENALDAAKKATEAKNNTQKPDDSKKDDTSSEKPEEELIYKAGTYAVAAICYPDEEEEFWEYTISMDVTIKQDKITAIENIVLTDPANRPFVKSKLLKAIIRKGTPEGVDTVTGATCSSKAILEACREALQQAKK